jgi:hypothetical protein
MSEEIMYLGVKLERTGEWKRHKKYVKAEGIQTLKSINVYLGHQI